MHLSKGENASEMADLVARAQAGDAVSSSAALAAQLLGKHTSPTQVATRAERLLRLQEALNTLDPRIRFVILPVVDHLHGIHTFFGSPQQCIDHQTINQAALYCPSPPILAGGRSRALTPPQRESVALLSSLWGESVTPVLVWFFRDVARIPQSRPVDYQIDELASDGLHVYTTKLIGVAQNHMRCPAARRASLAKLVTTTETPIDVVPS